MEKISSISSDSSKDYIQNKIKSEKQKKKIYYKATDE